MRVLLIDKGPGVGFEKRILLPLFFFFPPSHLQKIGEHVLLKLLILIVNQEMFFKKLCVNTGVM